MEESLIIGKHIPPSIYMFKYWKRNESAPN